jgi:hypothetical protein
MQEETLPSLSNREPSFLSTLLHVTWLGLPAVSAAHFFYRRPADHTPLHAPDQAQALAPRPARPPPPRRQSPALHTPGSVPCILSSREREKSEDAKEGWKGKQQRSQASRKSPSWIPGSLIDSSSLSPLRFFRAFAAKEQNRASLSLAGLLAAEAGHVALAAGGEAHHHLDRVAADATHRLLGLRRAARGHVCLARSLVFSH